MTIFFLIRSLEVGGAERQLVVLAKELVRRGFRVAIVTFYPGGLLEAELVRSGIELLSVDKKGRWDVAPFVARLLSLLRSRRPDVLYSFLPSENVISAVLEPFSRSVVRVWGVQTAYIDLSGSDWVVRLVYRAEALLSRAADLVVSNSEAGREHAVAKGFPPERTVVVGNGVDTARFRPDREAGLRVREGLGIAPDALVIGTLSRLDPLKDFPTFLAAAAIVARQRADARFLCVGGGALAGELEALARQLGLAERIVWAGARGDPQDCLNAMDVFCSSSITEGLSNSIAEAMACGLPCVVTDVGDSAFLVGDVGIVVPPRRPETLARALIEAADAPAAHRERVRERIVGDFSIEALGARTAAALEHAVLARRGTTGA